MLLCRSALGTAAWRTGSESIELGSDSVQMSSMRQWDDEARMEITAQLDQSSCQDSGAEFFIFLIFFYFSHHNGLSISTFFESILDGLRNVF